MIVVKKTFLLTFSSSERWNEPVSAFPCSYEISDSVVGHPYKSKDRQMASGDQCKPDKESGN